MRGELGRESGTYERAVATAVTELARIQHLPRDRIVRRAVEAEIHDKHSWPGKVDSLRGQYGIPPIGQTRHGESGEAHDGTRAKEAARGYRREHVLPAIEKAAFERWTARARHARAAGRYPYLALQPTAGAAPARHVARKLGRRSGPTHRHIRGWCRLRAGATPTETCPRCAHKTPTLAHLIECVGKVPRAGRDDSQLCADIFGLAADGAKLRQRVALGGAIGRECTERRRAETGPNMSRL